jgi:hypothetical protein
MTNQQQINQPQPPQYLEDRKAQKLIKQIEMKLTLQAKATRDKAAPSKN